MPSIRPPHLLFDDGSDELAFWLWRVVVDATLWAGGSESRKPKFAKSTGAAHSDAFPTEIRSEVAVLAIIYTAPDRAISSPMADAASTVAGWAEEEERIETSLQYAELAARLALWDSRLCSHAGRLCRRRKENHRGTIWFRRATRLASAFSGKKKFRDLTLARLGWAYLAQDLDALTEAEQHATKAFRAALRCGRITEAAQAYHALASILIHQGRLDEAWIHARNAVASYPADNPRFPALAHDIAFLWSRQGFFADAAVIYEKVLPSISRAEERLVVLANIARAGAAARDQLRYERAAREVMRVLHEGKEVPTSALYHLARAAVNIGDWSRAKMLADKIPPQQAPRWKKMLDEIYSDIQSRSGRDPDLIPEYGSEVYNARELLLSKLESYADPSESSAGSATSEKYPIS